MKISSPQRRWLGLSLLAALVTALALASVASAAAPANDPFSAPAALPAKLPLQVAGTNVEATKEAGEPEHGGDVGGHSVWYRWTAGSNMQVSAETCGTETTFDTLLGVYTGTEVNALTEVAGNDDGCESNASRLSFAATQGTTYLIAVDGYGGATGSFVLKLTGFVAAGTIQSSLTATDPTQTGRLFRTGNGSSCAEPNLVEPFDAVPGRAYKTFPISSLINEAACMAIEITAPECEGTKFIQSAVYGGAFDPTQLTANLLTAESESPSPTDTYQVGVGSGKNLTLAVNMVTPGEECPAFTVHLLTDRPWATAKPKVLSGGSDASGVAPTAGNALTAGAGTWASAVQHAFQWQACDAAGNACVDIANATAESFTPRFAQVGHTLRLVDTASDPGIASTSSIASAPTGVVKPSSVIQLGKFKANKKNGTGLLTVLVPGAGKLTLSGKGVKKAKGSAKDEGKVVLKVRPSRKTKKALLETGKASVKVEVTFVPDGGTAGTASRKLKLKKKATK